MRRLCRLLEVHPSGYYAWRNRPASRRACEDQRLLGLIRQFWLESGGVYGYRKIHDDLREFGERCGKHRVARLMRAEGLRAQVGYHRRPRHHSGRPAVVAPNHLNQQFDVAEPNQVWVTDITYIRTHEGWLYLAVVIDLFSRQVIGWSMQPRMDRELALNALLMAVWRRQPQEAVTVHSDQGSQFDLPPRQPYQSEVEKSVKSWRMTDMKKSRYSEEQIIGFLKQADAGMPIKELCRKGGFSDATFYKWRAKFGGMDVSDAKRLKELEGENAKLKKLLAEAHLDMHALKSVFGVKR